MRMVPIRGVRSFCHSRSDLAMVACQDRRIADELAVNVAPGGPLTFDGAERRAVCHNILDFSARVFAIVAAVPLASGLGRRRVTFAESRPGGYATTRPLPAKATRPVNLYG